MNLPRYLISKLLRFFLLTTGTLALLVTLVEFFEKIGRVHGGISHLATYSALSFLPHVVTLIPLGSWLAVGLLLWDCQLHHRWEALLLASISPKRCIRILAGAAIALSVVSFAAKEVVFSRLLGLAATYKQTYIKSAPTHSIIDEWLALSNTDFLHVDKLDLASGNAQGVTLITCSNNFAEFTHSYGASGFVEKDSLTLRDGFITNGFAGTHPIKGAHNYTLSGLHAAISLRQPTQSSLVELVSLMHARRNLRTGTLHAAFTRTIGALLAHLRPALIVILTLTLFFLLQALGVMPWLALMSYPVFAGCASFVEFNIAHGSPLLLLVLPYLLCLLLIRYGMRRLA